MSRPTRAQMEVLRRMAAGWDLRTRDGTARIVRGAISLGVYPATVDRLTRSELIEEMHGPFEIIQYGLTAAGRRALGEE